MIISYHPFFTADKNLLCAGRSPDSKDLAAIRTADAVVLPQGCTRSLYQMARQNCSHVFPNFDARFDYPGKIGQAALFHQTRVPCPATETFCDLDIFFKKYGNAPLTVNVDFPLVFKFDWGGEGDHVYLIPSAAELYNVLQIADNFEKSGRSGFLIQEYI